jgi:hypothetical protein
MSRPVQAKCTAGKKQGQREEILNLNVLCAVKTVRPDREDVED